MDKSFIINPESITYLIGSHKKKNEDKVVYYISIKINDVEKVLCWLSEKEFNNLTSSN